MNHQSQEDQIYSFTISIFSSSSESLSALDIFTFGRFEYVLLYHLRPTFYAFAFRHEQEKSQGVSEIGELKRRMKQLEEENEEISDNRLQLIGKESFFCCCGHIKSIIFAPVPSSSPSLPPSLTLLSPPSPNVVDYVADLITITNKLIFENILKNIKINFTKSCFHD